MKNQRIYMSGRMTGVANHNFPAFRHYTQKWREAGYEVCNPAESFDGQTGLPRSVYMRKDITDLLGCGGLALIPGWDQSPGAILEACIAKHIDIPVYDAETMEECLVTVASIAGLVSKETYEAGLDTPVDSDLRQDASRQDDTGESTL